MAEPSWQLPVSRQIEAKRLQEKSPKLGFAVYRCTYEDHDGWARFLQLLRAQYTSGLEFDEALDLLPLMDWAVHDNKEELDGASPQQIQSMFKAWADEQCKQDGVIDRRSPARYNYCIMVDQAALSSVLNPFELDEEAGIDIDNAYVIIINAMRLYQWQQEPASQEGEGEHEALLQEDFYMFARLFSIFPHIYWFLDGYGGWDGVYLAPPTIWNC